MDFVELNVQKLTIFMIKFQILVKYAKRIAGFVQVLKGAKVAILDLF